MRVIDRCLAIQPFDIDNWEQKIQQTTRVSGQAGGLKTPSGSFGENLVFIIGMPRSGTSLCEQVLSAHPSVLACGELTAIQNIENNLERRGIDPYSLSRDLITDQKEFELAASSYSSALPADYQKYQCVKGKLAPVVNWLTRCGRESDRKVCPKSCLKYQYPHSKAQAD